jgi:hypothetical protein
MASPESEAIPSTTRQPRKAYGTCTVIGEEYELSSPLEFTEVAA